MLSSAPTIFLEKARDMEASMGLAKVRGSLFSLWLSRVGGHGFLSDG